MTTRRVTAVLLGVVVAVSVGITPSIIQFFAQREVLRLQRAGVRIQVDGITGFFVGVAAKQLESWIGIPVGPGRGAAFPLQIRAEDVRASAHFSPFTATTSATLKGTLYGGAADATITNLLRSPLLTARLQKIDISSHPQLSALGIESGAVDVSVANHPLRHVWSAEAQYSLTLERLSLHPPPSVQSVSGISQLSDGSVVLKATVSKDGELSINEGSFDSSLASGTLRGSSRITAGPELTEINLMFRINLNRQDSSKIAAWLPILTNQSVPRDASSFSCTVRSVGCRVAGAVKFGAACVRASCAG